MGTVGMSVSCFFCFGPASQRANSICAQWDTNTLKFIELQIFALRKEAQKAAIQTPAQHVSSFWCSGPLPSEILTISRDFWVGHSALFHFWERKTRPAVWEFHKRSLNQVCSRVNHKENNFSLEIKLVLLQCYYTSGYPGFSNGEVVIPGALFGLREKSECLQRCCEKQHHHVTTMSSDQSRTDQSLRLGVPWGHVYFVTLTGNLPSWLPCLCPNVSYSGITKFASHTRVTPWIAQFSWQKAVLNHSKLNQ